MRVIQFYLVIIFVVFCTNLWGQDMHFSQFYNNPLNLNPAQAGLFDGSHRFTANYRGQWFQVPVPYITFCASYDTRLGLGRKGDYIGLGLTANYDQAGDSKLSNSEILGSFAIAKQLNRNQYLIGGAQVGYGQRRFNPSALTFDNQFDGEQFRSVLSSREIFVNTTVSHFSFNAGLSYVANFGKNNSFQLGAAMYHINQPVWAFNPRRDDARLPIRYSIYSNAIISVNKKLDLLPMFQYQNQGAYQELVVGGLVRHHLNKRKSQESSISAGITHRLGDATIAQGFICLKGWKFGVSYDISTDPNIIKLTDSQGAIEFCASYIIGNKRVNQSKRAMKCPTF